MSLADITEDAVLQAIAEFDRRGRKPFLDGYGFAPARSYYLVREGRHYDSKAILGAAHGYLGGGSPPLRAHDFAGGEQTVVPVLRRLGFEVFSANPRNPGWTRDELILALDLYMSNPASPPGKKSQAVAELSELLNSMAKHLGRGNLPRYRNANGVYMKMMNFRSFDPNYRSSGRVGLSHGNKFDEVIWDEFAGDPRRLAKVAAAIRSAASTLSNEQISTFDEDEGFEAEEGRLLTRLHRYRERDPALVRKRKALAVARRGTLACEACGFDFEESYGERGKGFIEAHHTKPVHTLTEGSKTRLDDLALVCSNCHRMIHASRPWLQVEELATLIRYHQRPVSE